MEVYCPHDVLQASGPLFGDIEGIQDSYDAFMEAKWVNIKLDMCKCTTCGYPDCDCFSCDSINESRKAGTKTKPKVRHTCALKHVLNKGGAPPKTGYYDMELTSHLTIAWQDMGITQGPKFAKKDGRSGYFWPEELEG